MSQLEVLGAIRRENEERALSNREYIGGLYFLIGLIMLQYCICIAIIQAYVLPLRRFEKSSPALGNVKFVALIYTFLLVIFYGLLTGLGGLTGWMVASVVLLLWALILMLVGAIRRCLRRRKEVDEFDRAGHVENVGTDKQINTSLGQSGDFSSNNSNSDSDNDHRPKSQGNGDKALAEEDDLAALAGASGEFNQSFDKASTASGGSEDGKKKKRKRVTSDFTVRARRRGVREENPWSYSPHPVTRSQIMAGCIALLAMLVTLTVILIIIFAWDVANYKIADREDQSKEENTPHLTTKSIQFMYAYETFATKMQLGVYVKIFTEWCGKEFTKPLTDAEKETEIKQNFIDQYKVNMSLYRWPDYKNYSTLNDWFIREINMVHRPLPHDGAAITSPADCRMMAFRSIRDSLNWFKGYELTYNNLLGGIKVEGSDSYFEKGGMVIARLAPEDYHRFHAPVAGTVIAYYELGGTYWSVGADAVRSGNDVMLNVRKILIIDAGARIGKVAYVAVGATCVASVLIQTESGQPIREGHLLNRGDQMGIMQFGGSTIVMLFAQDRVVFDENIIYRSKFPVETYALVNSAIGTTR